jgi:vacuolar-type H+-ATPase subunit I/STV1
LVKKVTIITPPEYESLILESLGRTEAIQLRHATGPDLEWLKKGSERVTDYKALYEKIHPRYLELLELSTLEIEHITPSMDELKSFVANPEADLNTMMEKLESQIVLLEEIREAQNSELNQIVDELQKTVAGQERELSEAEEVVSATFERAKARLESVRALEPEEFKNCFAAGFMKNDLIPRLDEYLKRYPDLLYKAVPTSSEESLLFIFGSEEGRKWVEALFLVFEVKDVFDVLDAKDVLLVLDSKKREEIIERYKKELSQLERGDTSQKRREIASELMKLKEEYDERLRGVEAKHGEENRKLMEEQGQVLGKIAYMDYLLRILSDRRAPVLRTNVISVLQGWIPENKVSLITEKISEVESRIGERLFVDFGEAGPDDTNIPNPEPEFKPSFLQPTWTLTTLRGWPSPRELNPSYISIIVFSFQFGLMYGDIGQGLIFLLIGFYLSKKYKRGLPYRLGGLMIPMGIAAIIFGFAYDSIFLIEHAISDALHNAHMHLPFHYPIMPNPVHETTKLMLIVFQIAMFELVFGLIIGAYNQIKQGNPVGALGEHGLGMILYIVGLYNTAMYFIKIGMDFMTALGSPWFLVCIAGILLSFLEPVLHSLQHGHGIGMEAIGEGVGGLLMTFVEGLANMFSFLRIAAFALAHASLAIAAEALSHSLGIAGVGLIIMNVIALSFEFVSSTVQSLRLLYYEFMGKFFQGEGIPFTPYRLRFRNK